MRTVVGVAVVIVCLGLTGCSLFGKKQAARRDNPRPFLGSKAPEKPDVASLPRESSGPLPGANGLLAGQVIVEATERPVKAAILIKNLNREDKGADLDISTDDSGYFQIPMLKTGEPYLLEARALEQGQLISYKLYAKPPNPALLLKLDRKWTTASTPPPPKMPHLGGNPATAGTDNNPEHKPTVSIDPPESLPGSGSPGQGGMAGPSPSPSPPPNPAGGNAPNPANIADSGFRRIGPQETTITIPSPPSPPPSPQWNAVPDPSQPARATPSVAPGSVRLPSIPTRVPSCVLLGNRLDNFALYDLNGEVWEYKRDRRGRLMLLDFWHHNCIYCMQGIPRLVELQRKYRTYGLEIVSIACEQGPVEEQKHWVRSTRGRYNINYVTLLSGGPSCPVCDQFQPAAYPLLVLIDSDGNIIWRSPRSGMDEYAHETLQKMIDQRLVTRQSNP